MKAKSHMQAHCLLAMNGSSTIISLGAYTCTCTIADPSRMQHGPHCELYSARCARAHLVLDAGLHIAQHRLPLGGRHLPRQLLPNALGAHFAVLRRVIRCRRPAQ